MVKLRVRFDDGSTVESSTGRWRGWIALPRSSVGTFRVGDVVPVRYDPSDHSNFVIDVPALEARFNDRLAKSRDDALARGEAQLERGSIPDSWVLGRATVVDVRKETAGALVDCTVTAKVRLVDGTPPYQATVQANVVQARADMLEAGRTLLAVHADPGDHSRVMISWTEDPPVVTVTDPDLIDSPARALQDGQPCRIVVLAHTRQLMKTPTGEELYAAKVRVSSDGSEYQIYLVVPDDAAALVQEGKELPAKRLAYQPHAIAVDWDAARIDDG